MIPRVEPRRGLGLRLRAALLMGIGGLLAAPLAQANTTLLLGFQLEYPASRSDDNGGCALCHGATTTSRDLNPYGQAIAANIGLGLGAFAAIEGLNSDADPGGYTNLEEINASTQPGWTVGDNVPSGVTGLLDPVIATNTPPVANPDSASTDVNTPVTINVLANDTDAEGDTLTVGTVRTLATTNGTVVDNTTNVTYTPNVGFCGNAAFEYSAFDGTVEGNFATVSVAVGDTNPPVVTAPSPDLVITLDPGTAPSTTVPADDPAIAAWLASATATDPEEGSLTVTNNAPAAFPVGTTAVTFSAEDGCGNTDSATANVIIEIADNGTPVVTAPTPDPLEVTAALCATSVTQGATADNYAGTIADWLMSASATDPEEGDLTVTDNAPALFPLGNTLVTFTATDSLGATGTATAMVSIAETPNTAPVVSAPSDLSLTVPAGIAPVPATDPTIAAWLASASATDAEDGDLALLNDAPAAFPVGTTTVTFTTVDGCGVTASATAEVTIVEEGGNTAPVVTAPDPFTVTTELCASSIPATDQRIAIWLSLATATDAEDGVLPVFNDAPALFPAAVEPGATTTVAFTATDSGGLTDTDTSTLTVIDPNNVPDVTAPAPLTLRVDAAPVPATDPAIAAWLASATASDVEDGTLGVTTDAPAEFPEGTTTVTFSATDSCGVTTTATSTVTIVVAGTGAEVNVFVKQNVDVRVDQLLKAYFWRDDMDIVATLDTACQYNDNVVFADSGRRADFNEDGFIDSMGRFPTADFGFDCGTHLKTITCSGTLRDGRAFFGTSNEFNVSGLGCGGTGQ